MPTITIWDAQGQTQLAQGRINSQVPDPAPHPLDLSWQLLDALARVYRKHSGVPSHLENWRETLFLSDPGRWYTAQFSHYRGRNHLDRAVHTPVQIQVTDKVPPPRTPEKENAHG